MYNKKGIDFGFPVYFIPSIVIFAITLLIFGLIFFGSNLLDSPKLVIKSEQYESNSKLLTILKTKTTVNYNDNNLTIAELIQLSYENEEYKKTLYDEVNNLLLKLPLPPKGKDLTQVNIATYSSISSSLQQAKWNFKVNIQGDEFISAQQDFGTKYLIQTTLIPLPNQQVAKVRLYLNCFSCSEEGLNAIV